MTGEVLWNGVGFGIILLVLMGYFAMCMLGSILLLGAFKSLKSQMDPEIYGGAPLLGVPGAVIITHGSSSHKAIYHAIRVGVLAAKNDMTGEISRRIAEYEMHKKSEVNGSDRPS